VPGLGVNGGGGDGGSAEAAGFRKAEDALDGADLGGIGGAAELRG